MKKENSKLFIASFVIIIVLLIAVIIILLQDKKYDEIPQMNEPQMERRTRIDNNKTERKQNYISQDEALSIALKHAGKTKQEVRDIDVELDYEYGRTLYEVTFESNNYEYEYYIEPDTGKIFKSFKEFDN